MLDTVLNCIDIDLTAGHKALQTYKPHLNTLLRKTPFTFTLSFEFNRNSSPLPLTLHPLKRRNLDWYKFQRRRSLTFNVEDFLQPTERSRRGTVWMPSARCNRRPSGHFWCVCAICLGELIVYLVSSCLRVFHFKRLQQLLMKMDLFSDFSHSKCFSAYWLASFYLAVLIDSLLYNERAFLSFFLPFSLPSSCKTKRCFFLRHSV